MGLGSAIMGFWQHRGRKTDCSSDLRSGVLNGSLTSSGAGYFHVSLMKWEKIPDHFSRGLEIFAGNFLRGADFMRAGQKSCPRSGAGVR
jgi:hypothetical protein